MSHVSHSIYKKWFWNVYDYLGTLMLLNVLWLICALPVVTLPASTAGLFRVTGRIAAYEEVSIRDFFIGMRQSFGRMWLVCGVYGVVLGLLSVNILFYINLIASWPWTGAILGGALIWLSAFVAVTGFYSFPLATQTDEPIRRVFRDAVYLVLDNPRASVGLLLVSGSVLFVSLATGLGIVLGGISAIGVLSSTGFREIYRRYDAKGTATETDAGRDMEEPRNWRDLLRPWEQR